MPKITKENHQQFRAAADLARKARKEARLKAQQLAKAILTNDPHIHLKNNLGQQVAAIHEAIMSELVSIGSSRVKGERLRELVAAEHELVELSKGLSNGVQVDGELKRMVGDDPEVIMGVKEALDNQLHETIGKYGGVV